MRNVCIRKRLDINNNTAHEHQLTAQPTMKLTVKIDMDLVPIDADLMSECDKKLVPSSKSHKIYSEFQIPCHVIRQSNLHCYSSLRLLRG